MTSHVYSLHVTTNLDYAHLKIEERANHIICKTDTIVIVRKVLLE